MPGCAWAFRLCCPRWAGQPVVRGGRAARGPGGVRGRPRRRVAALYPDDDRLRRRRRADGTPLGPVRRHAPVTGRRGRAGRRLYRRRLCDEPLAVRPGARAAGRAFGGAATFAPIVADTSLWFTRHRGIAVAIIAARQLSGRHGLAAGRAALRPDHRLAADVYRHRRVLRRRRWCRSRWRCAAGRRRTARRGRRASAAVARPLGMSPAALQTVLVDRRLRLLRRDVDAAGAHRRLLRRPRLRRRRAAPRCCR